MKFHMCTRTQSSNVSQTSLVVDDGVAETPGAKFHTRTRKNAHKSNKVSQTHLELHDVLHETVRDVHEQIHELRVHEPDQI